MLFQIETVFRELIVEKMTTQFGPNWFKYNVPEDVHIASLEKMKAEKEKRLISFIPFHQIYYADFFDLNKIIMRNNNWNVVFKAIFKQNVFVENAFIVMVAFRNKISHNRIATKEEREMLYGTFVSLQNAIGHDYFNELSERSTNAKDLIDYIKNTHNEINRCYEECKKHRMLTQRSCYDDVKKQWWFDDSYLCVELDNIHLFYKMLCEYEAIPQGRGKGHIIEKWVLCSNIDEKYRLAKDTINDIICLWS